jgi:hypothetical protein
LTQDESAPWIIEVQMNLRAAISASLFQLALVAQPAATVPFVGCASDGQIGPQNRPAGKAMDLPIPAAAAQRLAYYKAGEGPGVLGPRGWNCFGTYGSSGETLFVSPSPIEGKAILSGHWSGLTGPVIEFGAVVGDTSGRFEVARFIARFFPAHRDFVDRVVKEGFEPASDFPTGLYPHDKLTYRSSEVLEYETPPQSEGIGTMSLLKQNADPIRGVAILTGDTPDLLILSTRLPAAQADLTAVIIQQLEREAAHAP